MNFIIVIFPGKTFRVLREKEEKQYGENHTKLVILEIYDEMAEAMRTGKPYKTRIDPPPLARGYAIQHVEVAHDPRNP